MTIYTIIYTDASYCWKKQLKKKIKKGKICCIIDGEVFIEKVEQKRIKGLKQYSNLFELKAVLKALQRVPNKEKVVLFTDSQIVRSWILTEHNNLGKRISPVHGTYKKLVDKEIERLKEVNVKWIRRDKNKAGIILESEGNEITHG